MISSITLHTERGNFTNKLYQYKGGIKTFEFTDGINVITGRNGSGKSVLLNIIKTCCGIDDDSTYARLPNPMDLHNFMSDDKWITMPKHIENQLKDRKYPQAKISWDGAIVHHLTPAFFDPSDVWSRIDNPMREDDGLFSGIEAISRIFEEKKTSKGESTIGLLQKVFKLKTSYDEPLSRVNDLWMKTSDQFQNWLNSFSKEKGKPTLLIDELDEHLDLDNQKFYWNYISHLTQKWQVIVVSHSLFAFRQENVNHIPLNKDYFKIVRVL